METTSSVTYDGTNKNSYPIDISRGQPTKAQLSAEEIRVLRECNRESFYYRCLPFAFAGMAATYVLFQRGILTGHPRWGPTIKMTAAAFAGWLVGKVSYRQKCEEKFLHVQNSMIADAIRKKRGYVLERMDSEGGQFSSEYDLKDNNYTSYSSGDFHSSAGSLNFDKNVPYSELDDRDRPSMDNEKDNILSQPQPVGKSVTYDELRMRNREEYERQRRQPEIPKQDLYRRPWNAAESQNRPSMEAQDSNRKNEYGDTWDNPKFL